MKSKRRKLACGWTRIMCECVCAGKKRQLLDRRKVRKGKRSNNRRRRPYEHKKKKRTRTDVLDRDHESEGGQVLVKKCVIGTKKRKEMGHAACKKKGHIFRIMLRPHSRRGYPTATSRAPKSRRRRQQWRVIDAHFPPDDLERLEHFPPRTERSNALRLERPAHP